MSGPHDGCEVFVVGERWAAACRCGSWYSTTDRPAHYATSSEAFTAWADHRRRRSRAQQR